MLSNINEEHLVMKLGYWDSFDQGKWWDKVAVNRCQMTVTVMCGLGFLKLIY
jgi:hypothetical protein